MLSFYLVVIIIKEKCFHVYCSELHAICAGLTFE